MNDAPHHKTHPDIIKRLKRAEGHLRSIVEMLEANRSCVEVAQQLHAVEKAVTQAKKTLIHDHLDDCLEATMGLSGGARNGHVEEFKEITKYL